MKRIGLIATVVALMAALGLLNSNIHKLAPTEAEQEQAIPPPPKPAPPPPGADQALQPDETIGHPEPAKYRIMVGWKYDAANRANPTALKAALATARRFAHSHPGVVAMEIADLDVPLDSRSGGARYVQSIGFSINFKPVSGLTDNPGEGSTVAESINYILHEQIR